MTGEVDTTELRRLIGAVGVQEWCVHYLLGRVRLRAGRAAPARRPPMTQPPKLTFAAAVVLSDLLPKLEKQAKRGSARPNVLISAHLVHLLRDALVADYGTGPMDAVQAVKKRNEKGKP